MKKSTRELLADEVKAYAEDIDAVASKGYEAIAEYFDFETIYDIEFRIDGRFEYRSAKILLAGGDPTIYFDTADAVILGYWGNDTAKSFVKYDTRNEIDKYLAENFDLIRESF